VQRLFSEPGPVGPVAAAILTGLAIALLQIALSVFYWLAGPFHQVLAPTWEVIVLVVGLLLWSYARAHRRGVQGAVYAVLAFLVTIYLILGIAQGFARREFGYDVIVVLHIPYVPEIFRMMYEAEPLATFIAYMALVAAALALLVFGIVSAVRRVHRYARANDRRRAGVATGFALYVLLTAPILGISPPLTSQVLHQLDLAVNLEERLDATARRMEVDASRLRRQNPFLAKERPPTILLFIVESYGEVLFRPDRFETYRTFLADAEEKLTATGYQVRSRYLRAPVIGGSSWMASVSLLCGVPVPDQRRYESLFSTSIRCLPAMLREAGYHTVMVAANTTYREERYDRLLPFDDLHIRDDFGYTGPRYGWSFVPDQFAIQYAHERAVLRHRDRPLLVVYTLTSSHHPWSRVPPYFDDWDELDDDGRVYRSRIGAVFRNAFVRGAEVGPAYQASIEYSMRSIMGYLAHLPEDDTRLVVILGDHQPRRPLVDMDRDPWTVPVHVLSRDAETVRRFEAQAYRPGLILPPDEADVGHEPQAAGLEHFIQQLFAAYGAPVR
jgi:hypothetical protein